MPKFMIIFRTGSALAETEITAGTAKQALKLARNQAERAWDHLDFQPYDFGCDKVEDIEVCDEDGTVLASWADSALLLQRAAPALLRAAKLVVARWESGDLADAVRQLSAAVDLAENG